jgi:hypothetical protein
MFVITEFYWIYFYEISACCIVIAGENLRLISNTLLDPMCYVRRATDSKYTTIMLH